MEDETNTDRLLAELVATAGINTNYIMEVH